MQDKRVDVISMCSADGCIKPLRLRVTDRENQAHRIDIDEVLQVKDTYFVGAEAVLFICRATVQGIPYTIELRYHVRQHCWHLTKSIF